jgi:hypothetical protein
MIYQAVFTPSDTPGETFICRGGLSYSAPAVPIPKKGSDEELELFEAIEFEPEPGEAYSIINIRVSDARISSTIRQPL